MERVNGMGMKRTKIDDDGIDPSMYLKFQNNSNLSTCLHDFQECYYQFLEEEQSYMIKQLLSSPEKHTQMA